MARLRPRVVATLLLDVSPRMRGEPLTRVIRTAERMCELLEDDDALQLVTFHRRVQWMAPMSRLDRRGRSRLLRELRGLSVEDADDCDGSRIDPGRLERALRRTLSRLPAAARHERRVLVILSDGRVPSSRGPLTELAAQARSQGVRISTIEFGDGTDGQTLGALASAGGGVHHHARHEALAHGWLARALGTQRSIVADSMSMTLTPREGVEVARVLASRPAIVEDEVLVFPAPLAGEVIDAVVELRVTPPRECGPWQPLAITVQTTPLGGERPETAQSEARTMVSHLETNDRDRDVASAVLLAESALTRRAARALADVGRFEEATTVAESFLHRFSAMPRHATSSSVAEAYELLSDEVAGFQLAGYELSRASATCRDGNELPTMAERPAARLVALDTGRVHDIDADEIDIGRSRRARVQIPASTVSRRHAVIRHDACGYWLVDLGSCNTTHVNGTPITGQCQLRDDDIISVGESQLRFCTS